ncbi:MAG TPA: type II toxin-antitoxin system VapC family toxin [Solirubrobacterales bacterium]|nr:type II toxin-antitoxin system VapC family toxin [Solirubrobacterales bacterium]
MVVLDSWALLAYLRDEPAAPRVEEAWLGEGAAICSLNLGEALYIQTRERGARDAKSGIESARARLTVVDPDWPLIAAAAGIKARGGLSFADAFCLATAMRLDAPLWTGDPEILALDTEVELVDLR